MKKFFLFAVVVYISITMAAQPSLQYPQNAPEEGNIVNIQFVMPDGLDPLGSGANLVWDYSQVVPVGEAGMITAIDPLQAPGGENFPDADLVLNMNDSIYTYCRIDANSFEYLGTKATVAGFDALFVYSDPRTYMDFPFPYGGVFTDTYAGISSVSVAEVRLSANTSVIADAYGTLILPGGTYNDVLRTITTNIEIDSIFVNEVFTMMVMVTHQQYFWYAPNAIAPTFAMEITDAGGEIDTVCYYTAAGSGIGDNAGALSHFNVYPNPAEDHVTVEFNALNGDRVSILFVNQVGQQMLKYDIPNIRPGLVSQKVDISTLPPGIYFISIKCACGKQLTSKFVVR